MRRIWFVAALVLLSWAAPGPALSQDIGQLYRCPGNDYKTTITALEAEKLGCKLIKTADAEVPVGWLQFARGTDGTTYAVDPKRMVAADKSRIRLWVRSDATNAAPPATFASSMELWEVDCDSSQIRLTQVAKYDLTGRPISANPPRGIWASPFPESVGEEIMKVGCNKVAKLRRQAR